MKRIAIAVAILVFAFPARAQEVVHQWMQTSVDTTAMAKYHTKAVFFEDTASVEKAGPKRQVWRKTEITTWDRKGVATTTDRLYTVMFNWATYQLKFENDPWRDIDLSPDNEWLKSIKRVCPKEESK
jgi:hypothetical protein